MMRKDVMIALSAGGVFLLLLIIVLMTGRGPSESEGQIASGAGPDRSPQADPAPPAPSPRLSIEDEMLHDHEPEADVLTLDPAVGRTASVGPAAADDPAEAPASGGVDWARLLEGSTTLMNAGAAAPSPQDDLPPYMLNSIEPAEVPEPAAAPPAPAPVVLPADEMAVAPAAARTHTVQERETFSSIAAHHYGNASLYPHLMRANPDIEPERLRPGMVLNLPEPSELAAPAAAARPQHGLDPNAQYRVQENDSLYRISVKLYGRPDRADDIYEANRELIGADPNRIREGMVLRLPDPPTVGSD